jgi:hypothetical protein
LSSGIRSDPFANYHAFKFSLCQSQHKPCAQQQAIICALGYTFGFPTSFGTPHEPTQLKYVTIEFSLCQSQREPCAQQQAIILPFVFDNASSYALGNTFGFPTSFGTPHDPTQPKYVTIEFSLCQSQREPCAQQQAIIWPFVFDNASSYALGTTFGFSNFLGSPHEPTQRKRFAFKFSLCQSQREPCAQRQAISWPFVFDNASNYKLCPLQHLQFRDLPQYTPLAFPQNHQALS